MPISSEDRILRFLKFRGGQHTDAVARHFSISTVAARKQLAGLHEAGLLAFEDEAGAIGRPKRRWRLTPKADARFPDTHAVLTLEMIQAVRSVFGADGLDRLIAEREHQATRLYARMVPAGRPVEERLAALAARRSEEGYMAEWQRTPDGWLLVENHCPICAAAHACRGFCRSELDMFRAVLGNDVAVERTEHIVAGARRCAYAITLRAAA